MQEISDIRLQMKSVETKRITVETDYANKYEGILREKLQELRETYEDENRRFRDDTEKLYQGKVRICHIVIFGYQQVTSFTIRHCALHATFTRLISNIYFNHNLLILRLYVILFVL